MPLNARPNAIAMVLHRGATAVAISVAIAAATVLILLLAVSNLKGVGLAAHLIVAFALALALVILVHRQGWESDSGTWRCLTNPAGYDLEALVSGASLLFREMPIGLIIVNAEGRVAAVNPFLARLFCQSEWTFQVGQPLRHGILHSEGEDGPAVLRALHSGISVQQETTFTEADGRTVFFWIEAQPLLGPAGNRLGAFALYLNTSTERQGASAQFTAAMALKHVRDDFHVVDAGGRIVASSSALADAGRPFTEVFCAGRKFDAAGHYTSRVIEVLETGAEYRDRLVDEGENWYRLNVRRLIDPNGQVVGAFSMRYNITAEQQLKELVRRSEGLSTLGELACTTVHELRNPLTAMRATAQLGLIARDSDEHYECFGLIIQEVDRLNELVGELVTLARPAGKEAEKVDVNQAVSQTVPLLHGRAALARVAIETDLAAELPTVSGSRRLFKQALINLFINAIQAMPDGGKLYVRTREADRGHLEVLVKDSGTGMNQQTLGRLFSPFFTTKSDGVGLGLSVTQQIITEVHGGRIWFESEEGQGSTAHLLLPSDTHESHSLLQH